MGGEVGDQQPAARAQQTCGVGDRRARRVEQVQDVVHDGDVEAARLERRPVQVAMAHRRARELSLTERRPGHLKHFMIDVQADAVLGVRSEQLEDAAGTGADVEQPADRALADEHVEQRPLDRRLADVQLAQSLQLVGVRAAIRDGGLDPAWRTRESAARSAEIVTSLSGVSAAMRCASSASRLSSARR